MQGILNTAWYAVTASYKNVTPEMGSTAATWEVKRETSRPTATRTELESATCCLLEELGEWVSSRPTRGGAALALHGVIWVIAIVIALSQLRVGQNLVCLIHNSHLRFTATLIWVCGEGSLATRKETSALARKQTRMPTKYAQCLLDRPLISIPCDAEHLVIIFMS